MLLGYLTNSKVWGNLLSFVTHLSLLVLILSAQRTTCQFSLITIIKPLICVMISVWKATNR